MDIQTLFALALQDSKVKANEVTQLLQVVDFSGVTSITDLRLSLESIGRLDLLPTEKSWNYALNIDEQNKKYGIQSFSISSEGYPKHLKAIDNAPNVLHVRGDIEVLQNIKGIAVVGSRKISKAGAVIAHRIALQAVERDWVVVSGLALGVDAKAHRGALAGGKRGATIAVLAHGLEKAKPVANAKLGQEILDNGGAWVSEHPVGTPARPPQFVARNRIQLGLSVGSIIIEAEEKSGSITQAKFCLQQKRPLYAVIPESQANPFGMVCSGTLMLVNKMGANPLRNKNDYPEMFERFERQKVLMQSL
ncbi:DNA-processing protein DprA [Vibrio alginolyticus]|uniref:DNA-processing protein DprA n=1 Tax=Vibrio harveyi group TaxID=717610 RepID=UPI0015DEA956|nr:DNA-processing protein DprA [Vibrio parahaemolyticus]ELB2838063.1 DNA-protecting protein DprA [Vibrio alginolyticus]EJG0642336.1 DNA-protecting protein DprA [Vibrio parahaemolyticus]EJG0645724.1 DNA-protecting protein DprA [Vibrio parahaemolyticus]EJG1185347.1 DNA-protecting protein DprA [Vibrio parahaemolyticus]EJP3283560.1 DNA-protecting protein DprA [Vibrio parahaemolyticus]